MIDYEGHYLELAARPGSEALRRDCPCLAGNPIQQCPPCYRANYAACTICAGRNWLPLPEAQRLDGLVRVAGHMEVGLVSEYMWEQRLTAEGIEVVVPHPGYWWARSLLQAETQIAPEPWQAATEAVLAANRRDV